MAYSVHLSQEHDDETLFFAEFEGGQKRLTIDIEIGGQLMRGRSLEGCLAFGIRVPSQLMAAVPTRIVVQPRKRGPLPDFGVGPWGGWYLVSKEFVEIVERLEPGIHQFLPIPETIDPTGRQLDKKYFLMNILKRVNAVDVERSTVRIDQKGYFASINNRSVNTTVEFMTFLPGKQVLALRKLSINGLHLWRGIPQDIVGVGFSDELYEAVRTADLSSLDYLYAVEV